MYPETFAGVIKAIGGLWVLATVHLILGGLFAAFLIAHLYLATTGETIGENFKAMAFGYGTKEDHVDAQANKDHVDHKQDNGKIRLHELWGRRYASGRLGLTKSSRLFLRVSELYWNYSIGL